MNANDLQSILESVLGTLGDRPRPKDADEAWKDDIDGDGALAECRVTSYAAGGYLTRDAGLVVRLADGSEFQITIVQTGYAAEDDDEDSDDESLGTCTACGRNVCHCDE